MKQSIFGRLNEMFDLNEMQLEAFRLKGSNIVLSAPTGSGKTEAILLNLRDGEKYLYFLPTVTSCIFMYKRLLDAKLVNVEIATSKMSEKKYLDKNFPTIKIMTPDPICINYLQGETYNEGLILDELDNYPTMVKSVFVEWINTDINNHIIVASATLDKGLQSVISVCDLIQYNNDMILDKHIVKVIKNFWYDDEIKDMIKGYVNSKRTENSKRIGIICNSILDIEDVVDELGVEASDDVIILHSKLTDYERQIAEDKLYNGDYTLVISNDLISYSVDVDFDILFMQVSDKMNINIQRMGRNNRRNKVVNETNLYIIQHGRFLKFICDYTASKHIQEYYSERNVISFSDVQKMRNELSFDELPTVDYIKNVYWKKLKENEMSLNLREVPLSFMLHTQIEVSKINPKTGENEIKLIDTTKTITWKTDEFPWSWYPYDRDGNKSIVHLYGENYIITNIKDGIRTIEEIDNTLCFDEDGHNFHYDRYVGCTYEDDCRTCDYNVCTADNKDCDDNCYSCRHAKCSDSYVFNCASGVKCHECQNRKCSADMSDSCDDDCYNCSHFECEVSDYEEDEDNEQ